MQKDVLKHLRRALSIVALGVVIASPQLAAATGHACAADAAEHASALLKLHSDNDERAHVMPGVTVLKPIQNPENKKQHFDVLEMHGWVYKAQYRMRVIYAQMPGQCALIGQEILELTSL